ncbi:hypothetical protein, partial [Helicobacter bizzozeronii]
MADPKDPQAFQRVGIAQVVDVNNQTTPDPTQLQHQANQPQDLAQEQALAVPPAPDPAQVVAPPLVQQGADPTQVQTTAVPAPADPQD